MTAGRAVFELAGERKDAPAGTFVFVERGVMRTAFAEEPGTTLLVIGGAPGEAYVPDGWELWSAAAPALRRGRLRSRRRPRPRAGRAEPAAYPTLLYNLACAEALAGRKEDAIEHLRQSIALDERGREYAKGDSDFDSLRDEPAFQQLVG